jgi:thiamine biosynthesis lipoprotein
MAPLNPTHKFAHQAMGTFFEIVIAHADGVYAGQAAQAAFGEIDRIERLFSRFDLRSEIGQINRMKPGQRLPIGFETYECLTIAEQVREETGGAFDVNRKAWENRNNEQDGDTEEEAAASSPAAFSLLETEAGFEITRSAGEPGARPALDLDLGGIGKGYALDSALEILLDWDIADTLLHGGTSTALAAGTAPRKDEDREGWPVGVGGGWPSLGVPRELVLFEQALSGSGTEVKGAHIIDPRTGKSAHGHVAAWAVHSAAAVADALSTAFMVMSTDEVESFCARHTEAGALLVVDYGKCRVFNFGI